MKKSMLFSAIAVLAGFGGTAGAEELGRVISSTPVIQQVAVPRQVCNDQPMTVQQPTTGAGAIMGGIAGGAVGNAIGAGSGRTAATALGVVGGALLGNNIEGSGSRVQNVRQCGTQTFYENRTTGYNVRYEYAGKEYNVQLPYDPGPTIRLQLTPVSGEPSRGGDPAAGGSTSQQQVVVAPPVVQPAVVAGTYPAYPVYAPAPYYAYPAYPYYPPVGLSLGFVFGGHRHWR